MHNIVLSFLVVCQYEDVNVTVERCFHNYTDNVYVNYSIQCNLSEFVPITVEIYLDRESMPYTFRCQNKPFNDTHGMEIGKVVFTDTVNCIDPTIIINKHLTVNISLELEVTVDTRQCNTLLIGPQSEYVHSIIM